MHPPADSELGAGGVLSAIKTTTTSRRLIQVTQFSAACPSWNQGQFSPLKNDFLLSTQTLISVEAAQFMYVSRAEVRGSSMGSAVGVPGRQCSRVGSARGYSCPEISGTMTGSADLKTDFLKHNSSE